MNTDEKNLDTEKPQIAERVPLSDEEVIHRFHSLCIRFGEAQYVANYDASRELAKRANEYKLKYDKDYIEPA